MSRGTSDSAALEKFIKADLWNTVMKFIEAKSILATEAMSLYRYLKALLSRILTEKVTLETVNKIDALNLEKVCRKREVYAEGGSVDKIGTLPELDVKSIEQNC